MEGFFTSFKPIWEKYNHEIILIITSLILIIISLQIYLFDRQTIKAETQNIVSPQKNNQTNINYQPLGNHQKIRVEISGEINKPDVYTLEEGARLNDLVKNAGGLTSFAEKNFFSRNFNLARVLVDQEKIYIPSNNDITNGVFIENQKVLEYLNPQAITQKYPTKAPSQTDEKIDINNAETEELQLLPGVGEATATKIINNRPYTDISELLTKKTVSKKTFEAIRDLIRLN